MRRNDIVCSHSASVRLEIALRWVSPRLNASEVLVTVKPERSRTGYLARELVRGGLR
jgi:hypothetical protein